MEKNLKNDEIEDVDEKQGQGLASLMYVMDEKENDTSTTKPAPGTENMQSSGSSNNPEPAVHYENKFRRSVWNKDHFDDGKPMSSNYLNINPSLLDTGPQSILCLFDFSKFSCRSKRAVVGGTWVKVRKISSDSISAAKSLQEDNFYPSNRKMIKIEHPFGKITKENVSFSKQESDDSDNEELPYPGSSVPQKYEPFSADPAVQLLENSFPDENENESDSDIEMLN